MRVSYVKKAVTALVWVLVMCWLSVSAYGQDGLAVPPNGAPAPALEAGSRACYATCVLPSDIVAADFDGDGWSDLAVACSGSGVVSFYANRALAGPGVFTRVGETVPANGLPFASQLEAAGGTAYVLWNSLAFAVPNLSQIEPGLKVSLLSPLPVGANVFAVGDLDHDARSDDVVVGAGNTCLLYTSGGVLGSLAGVAGNAVALAFGDMNQDAWTDVVVLTSEGLFVSYNARYASPPFLLEAVRVRTVAEMGIANPTDVALGDFDSDGLLDIVVVGNTSYEGLNTGMARVFLNMQVGPGSAFAPVPATVPMRTWGFNAVEVLAHDVDGNGRDDFLVLNKDTNNVTVFLTDAQQSLVADRRATTERCLSPGDRAADRLSIDFRLYKLELECGFHPVGMALADFDFNGKDDLAIAHQSPTREVQAQKPSCIEVLFDIACGFHVSATENVPGQLRHTEVVGEGAGEVTSCPACQDCGDNEAPSAGIGTGS